MARPFKRARSNVTSERIPIPPSPENSDDESWAVSSESFRVRTVTRKLNPSTLRHSSTLKRSSSFLSIPTSPNNMRRLQASAETPSHYLESNPRPFESLNHMDAVLDNSAPDWDATTGEDDPAAADTSPESARSTWYAEDRDVFVAEMMFHEGRGISANQASCTGCGSTEFDYRCRDCFFSGLLCKICLIRAHVEHPFHTIEQWNGSCFVRRSLKDIGLRIQLGHSTRSRCPDPVPTPWDDFVVLDINGQHTVSLDFCGCASAVDHSRQLLRAGFYPATSSNPKTAGTFRLLKYYSFLSAEGDVSAWQMYQALMRSTDNTGMNKTSIPNRYPALREISRQWQHLTLMKRGGKGHAITGVATIASGELALLCPACPQSNINTTKKSEQDSWLNTTFVGLDANFRLKRFDVSDAVRDPALNCGGAYMVESTEYESFIRNVSDLTLQPKAAGCHDFKAIRDANTAPGKRVAVNGLGTVDCIRHGFKRPVSMVDIPKGEKFLHMDYALFSTLSVTTPQAVLVSYDIACQYEVHIWDRRPALPSSLGAMKHDPDDFSFLVPKFHLPGHIEDCRLKYSFNTAPGVGRTDGEAPERNWSYLDRFAGSTRAMGPGSRKDFLDFVSSDGNWCKFTDIAYALKRKLKEAIARSKEHKKAFEELNSAMQQENIKKWLEQVLAWEADKSQPNPYQLEKANVPSEKAVRLKILQEEQEIVALGGNISLDNSTTPFTFITAGLDLAELQYRLDYDASKLGEHSTDIQRAKVVQRGTLLVMKIRAWLQLQQLYFPDGASLQMQNGLLGEEDQNLLKTPLPLPSRLHSLSPCNQQLAEYEWDLRAAQAHDSLEMIRSQLRARHTLHNKTKRFYRGQKDGTRSNQHKAVLQERLQLTADRYRRARQALLQLAERLDRSLPVALQELNEKDLRHLAEGEDGQSEGGRIVSWIWKVVGVSHSVDDDTELRNELRIEWCMSRARANRWSEEVSLVQEEMQRVQRFYLWKAAGWDALAKQVVYKDLGVDYSTALVDEGRRAYANRQALLYRSLNAFARRVWSDKSGDVVPAVAADSEGPSRAVFDGNVLYRMPVGTE